MSARILLIEDEVAWTFVLRRILEDEGYQVEVAKTVEEARAKLGLEDRKPKRVDLLIVDIRFPSGREGLEIIEELRTQQDEAGISAEKQSRVIMSSVLNQFTVPQKWKDRVRWDAFLIKPYDLRQLVALVRSLLYPNTNTGTSEDSQRNE